MTKGGKKTKNTTVKTSKKTSLKVKVLKTAKPKKTAHAIDKKEHVKKRKVRKKKISKEAKNKVEQVERSIEPQTAKGSGGAPKVRPRIVYEKVERDKLLIIRAGVTFVMLFIVIGWIFSMKLSLRMIDDGSADQLTIENIKELTSDVTGKIEKISKDINKVQSFAVSNIENLATTSVTGTTTERSPFADATSTMPLLIEKLNMIKVSTSTMSAEEEELEELKKRIEELENKISE